MLKSVICDLVLRGLVVGQPLLPTIHTYCSPEVYAEIRADIWAAYGRKKRKASNRDILLTLFDRYQAEERKFQQTPRYRWLHRHKLCLAAIKKLRKLPFGGLCYALETADIHNTYGYEQYWAILNTLRRHLGDRSSDSWATNTVRSSLFRAQRKVRTLD